VISWIRPVLPRSSTRRNGDLLGTYVDVASAAVTELGGKIIRKQGDGLMVLFGYPVALENDAEALRGRPCDPSLAGRIEPQERWLG
jgi:class 3 adenylate cyclase